MWTQMSMGSAQALSAVWLTAKMEDHKRPIALAAYVMSMQLANFPGNQLFRTEGMSLPWVLSLKSQSADFCGCTQILTRACYCCLLCLCCCCYHTVLEVVVSNMRPCDHGRERCTRYSFGLERQLVRRSMTFGAMRQGTVRRLNPLRPMMTIAMAFHLILLSRGLEGLTESR